jgi:hypothetical protein
MTLLSLKVFFSSSAQAAHHAAVKYTNRGRPSACARSRARDSDLSQEMMVGSGVAGRSGEAEAGPSVTVGALGVTGGAALSRQPATASVRRPRTALRMSPFVLHEANRGVMERSTRKPP